jgi:hypothetical protein
MQLGGEKKEKKRGSLAINSSTIITFIILASGIYE